MILTAEQSEALEQSKTEAIEMVDPRTHRHYVLIAADILNSLNDELEDARHAAGWQKLGFRGAALALGDEA